MSVLKVSEVRDLAGIGGFSLSAGSITTTGTLKVTNLNINGTISGSSTYNIPNFIDGNYLTTDGNNLSWTEVSAQSGFRSMQVWTSNGTWTKPSGVASIKVQVVGAGGGGSGYCESAGAGGFSERVLDVTNISSVSVTIGNPGGGTNYAGCGGAGNTSSFGSYCSGSGGQGANCRQQHAGGTGGNGSGGNLNVYGGGGNGHGSNHSYGNYSGGRSFYGGSQPGSHRQQNYAHRHQNHAAWGAGGNGSRNSNRGARGREGVVVVYEYYG
jgi:hypothetical protein